MALFVFLDNKNKYILPYLDLFLLATIMGELFLCKTEGYIEVVLYWALTSTQGANNGCLPVKALDMHKPARLPPGEDIPHSWILNKSGKMSWCKSWHRTDENYFLCFLIQLNCFCIFRSVIGCRADAVFRAWAVSVCQQGRDNIVIPSRHRETVVYHISGTGEHSIASYCWFSNCAPFLKLLNTWFKIPLEVQIYNGCHAFWPILQD